MWAGISCLAKMQPNFTNYLQIREKTNWIKALRLFKARMRPQIPSRLHSVLMRHDVNMLQKCILWATFNAVHSQEMVNAYGASP